MAFLARIGLWIVTSGLGKFVLDYVLSKLVALGTSWQDSHQAAIKAREKAIADAQAVKDAKTKTEEERKNAIKANLGL